MFSSMVFDDLLPKEVKLKTVVEFQCYYVPIYSIKWPHRIYWHVNIVIIAVIPSMFSIYDDVDVIS